MKIVLILNDLFGFPSALRKNVSRNQPWAMHVCDQCMLTSTDRIKSFEDSIAISEDETIFLGAQKAGVETVLLGPSPPHWRQSCSLVHTNTYELPDPTCELYSRGVNRCSLYNMPPERWGCASVYDDDVCDQACDLLQSFRGDRLLLWVNFSCFDDLNRIRFEATDALGPGGTCIPPQSLVYDRRSLPLSVSTYLDGISESSRRTEQQYVSLLEAATRLLDRHRGRIERVVRSALSHEGTRVAYTSTHSLSIFEHAVRGGHAPLGTCCETFWISNATSSSSVNHLRPHIRDLIAPLMCSVCTIPRPTTLSEVTECRDGFYRHLVHIEDHLYSCIVRHGRILFVFDLSSDPEELHDVHSSLGHLSGEFARRIATVSDVDGSEPPHSSSSVPSVHDNESVAPTLHSMTTSPSETSSSSKASRQSSFSRRPSTNATASHAKPRVRQTEARLNKLHR